MEPVSKAEFFRRLAADPRDIMPHLIFPDCSTWETVNRVLWGRSFPGWHNPGDLERYEVMGLSDTD